MALINFTNLDFDQIKTTIREYIRSNSNFTDHDFEGSNLSTIIDVLAYTTYLSSYNANMVSNEVFIDSATLRENVVSLAKHIGYTPRSVTSSKAVVSFFVNTTSNDDVPLSLTLRKGIVATTRSQFGGKNFVFSLNDDVTTPVVNGIARFNNVVIQEGIYLETNFSVDANIKNQRFILDNPNIDTSSIRVLVRESQESAESTRYNLCTDLCVTDSSSEIYFLQEIEDQRYELIFGDGIFGKKLENGNIVEVSYITSQAIDSANRIKSFSFAGRIFDNNNNIVTSGISLLSTLEESQGGRKIESVDSIKKYAPLVYSAQNRAVTSSDYEAIISQVYPEAESVSVFGGEELDPPQYGRVFITIKPYEGEILPLSIKQNITDDLKRYSVAGIVPEILDLKYLYIEYDVSAYYNINKSRGADTVRTKIFNNIQAYADSTELNQYGARFKYSNLLKIIDQSDDSITSNITNIVMRRDLKVALNSLAEYELCFGNSFHIKNPNGFNIKSSGFKISNSTFDVYLSDIPKNNIEGEIVLIRIIGDQPNIIRRNFGSINYQRGEILLNPTTIISTQKIKFGENIIEISVSPKSNDVIGLQDLYLQLDTENSKLNMVRDTISSGEDSSGSTYISSSSYTNGSFIRN